VLVSESLLWGEERKAARTKRYKLVSAPGEAPRLYDLQLDPLERSPILQLDFDDQAIVRELEAALPPFRRAP
jgi:hypothetical protein